VYFASIEKEIEKSSEVSKVIYISLCMLFIAHAAIHESSKSLNECEDLLSEVMKLPIPTTALK
jgi:hypothetical protein